MSEPSRGRSTRVAAYGLVTRPGEILLCRISPRVPAHAGRWTLPGGGIDFGERPAEAMVREVHEETGLIVRATGVAGVDSLVTDDGAATIHGVRILYFTEVIGGVLTHEADGSTDRCEWHAVEALESIDVVGLVQVGVGLLAGGVDSASLSPVTPPRTVGP